MELMHPICGLLILARIKFSKIKLEYPLLLHLKMTLNRLIIHWLSSTNQTLAHPPIVP
jgi:hypothetical protein